MRRRRDRQRGQALLESALATTAFLVVMIGMVDIAQVLYVHQSLVERVRGASRFGAVQAYDANAIENMVLYDQPTVPVEEEGDDDEGGAGTPAGPPKRFLGLDPSMITVTRHDATSNADRIEVTVTGYPFRFFTPFIAAVHQGKPISATIPYEGP